MAFKCEERKKEKKQKDRKLDAWLTLRYLRKNLRQL